MQNIRNAYRYIHTESQRMEKTPKTIPSNHPPTTNIPPLNHVP